MTFPGPTQTRPDRWHRRCAGGLLGRVPGRSANGPAGARRGGTTPGRCRPKPGSGSARARSVSVPADERYCLPGLRSYTAADTADQRAPGMLAVRSRSGKSKYRRKHTVINGIETLFTSGFFGSQSIAGLASPDHTAR